MKAKLRITEEGRECAACLKFKEWDNFYASESGSHGRCARCIDCYAIKSRERYLKTKTAPDLDVYLATLRQKSLEAKANKDRRSMLDKANSQYKGRRDKRLESLADRPRPRLCEVCSGPGNKLGIVFDHCHNSDKFRGWLCNGCNTALGQIKDNPETLRKLADYLDGFTKIVGSIAATANG